MRRFFLALALSAAPAAAAQEVPVDLELVLAVDISGSVDAAEAAQQREGYVSALADPAVIRAIRATPTGRVAVTYVEWAGTETREVVVPWTLLEDGASAAAFRRDRRGAGAPGDVDLGQRRDRLLRPALRR